MASDWGEGVSEDDEEEIATQKTTRDKIAVMFDVDRNNVQRFLRLSYLIPELLDYADNKSLSVIAGRSALVLQRGNSESTGRGI